jgi:hypothetical protein
MKAFLLGYGMFCHSMPQSVTTKPRGVLNEETNTVHRPATGQERLDTRCGHTDRLSEKQMRLVVIESAIQMSRVSKCGTCFESAGGY